jgi:hypothetical protein
VDHLSVAPEKPVQLFLRPPLAATDPVRTLNYDDLARLRLTVFFRFFMVLPHLIWLGLWGQAMVLLAPVMWIAALVKGRPPDGLREVFELFVRYATHVFAYWFLAAERFPGFLGRPRTYAIDVEFPPNGRQNRWSIGFRWVLAIPASVLVGVLTTGSFTLYGLGGVASVGAMGIWFFALARGRAPQGLRDLVVWSVAYGAQVYAYAFLLTGRYPNSDPAVAPLAPLPAHPIRLELTDELRRDRWLVAFRYVLAFPHNIWWTLWTVLAIVVAFLGWVAALVLGRLPRPLHRFLAAWVRYSAHYNAFFYLGGGLFPGFLGREGSYPVDIVIAAPERQSRWGIAFRIVLAIPPLVLCLTLSGVLTVCAFGGWFFALFMGRMPRGIRNATAFCVRYVSQTFAYLVLVSPRYPYSGPGDFHR